MRKRKIVFFSVILLFLWNVGYSQVLIENPSMRLLIGNNGIAISLIHKASGEECLAPGVSLPVFSAMQYRPYDNENQLTYVTRPTTYNADTVFRKRDTLFVGFERLEYLAVIHLKIEKDYIGFELNHFIQKEKKLGVKLETRIDGITFLQLAVNDREHFGEWLNVSWDDQVAINLLATDVYTRVDDRPEKGYHIMRAGSLREIKLTGTGAALIVTTCDSLLDRVASVEQDYNLPGGVQSRRHQDYQFSYYECREVSPKNIDEHIQYALRGGFRMMVFYYPDFATTAGHFPWSREYPNGIEDLQFVTGKVQEAGIIPGFHMHYNKAHIHDPYVSPVPDCRLNLRKIFSIANPLNDTSTTITINENPGDITLLKGRRLLRIGEEIIEYTNYTNVRPYCFTGCKRGVLGTKIKSYPKGHSIGLLDVDNWPIFIRFNQQTSIQDEVAERLAGMVKEAGFQFLYFDGAEDVNQPYWFNVSLAQKRLYDKLQPKPIFAEGSCKTHFNWHMMSRGNAFDTFDPEEIKEAVNERYIPAAEYNAENFTTVNFGWIDPIPPGEKTIGLQPDMVEYVASHAAGWDAPLSLIGDLNEFKSNPRTPDNLAIFKYWEEARRVHFFTEADKISLRELNREFILLVNEDGNYELQSCRRVKNIAGNDPRIRAFFFKRENKSWLVYWHTSGTAKLKLGTTLSHVKLFDKPGTQLKVKKTDDGIIMPLGGRRFISTDLTEEQLIRLFEKGTIIAL